jgi:hypothetical protein
MNPPSPWNEEATHNHKGYGGQAADVHDQGVVK